MPCNPLLLRRLSSSWLRRTMASFAQVVAAVAPVYSIHPYTFSERGTNEVYNCMIRCAFPRDESLDAISSDNVAKLNNMP